MKMYRELRKCTNFCSRWTLVVNFTLGRLYFFFSVPVCAITASAVPGGTLVSMNLLVPCAGD
jgi:hypothetical protein